MCGLLRCVRNEELQWRHSFYGTNIQGVPRATGEKISVRRCLNRSFALSIFYVFRQIDELKTQLQDALLELEKSKDVASHIKEQTKREMSTLEDRFSQEKQMFIDKMKSMVFMHRQFTFPAFNGRSSTL